MPGHARRSRLVTLGLSVGALAGLVTGMMVTEHPPPAAPPEQPGAAARDSFATGGPATPPSSAPTERIRRTVTSAS